MRRLGTCLLLLLGVMGCRDKASPASEAPAAPAVLQLTETEPNGRPEQALRIGSDADVQASLSVDPAAPDEDWYLLEPSGAVPRVDIRVGAIPGGDVALEIHDEHRNRLVAVNSEGVGQPERIPNLYLTGRRYLRVLSAKKGTGGAYTLEVRFSPAEPGEEAEPNDRAVDADAIPLGTPVTGLVGHAGDEDWYRFELTPPDAEASLTGGDPEGTGAPMAAGPDAAAPGAMGAPPSPSPTALADRIPAQETGAAPPPAPASDRWADDASTDGWPTPGGSGPAPREERSALPPDDDDAHAEDGAPRQEPMRDALWGRLRESAGDEDGRGSLQVGSRAAMAAALETLHPTAPPPEPEPPSVALRFELTGIEGVSQELRVLSEAEAVLFETKTRPGEGLSLRNIGVRPQDRVVYVVVRSAWSGSGKDARRAFSPTLPYSLTVSREEGGANAELEPNDELAKATPISPQVYREGFLSQPTDVDTYVLRAPDPVIADFQVTGVEGVDLALLLIEKTEKGEKVLMAAREGGVKEPEQLNAVSCHGECYVRVESALRRVDGKLVKDFANADVPYRLTVTTYRDDGSHEREPNNDAASATPLSLGRAVRGTIHPTKDSDFFRLDLSDRIVRTRLRAHLSGILKVDVGLYLHRLEPDGTLTLVQTADRAKGEEPELIRYSAEPGIWLLEVRDAKNRASNFQDRYQLTVLEGD